jgi:probable O-glycosylation ligase (exosortase A-associated)
VRDIVLLAALLGVAPLIVRAPIVGLLAWIWITLLNPQREVYGFLSGFGLNLYIAVLTVLAWAASKERKAAPPNVVTFGLIIFAAWTTVTTITAFDRSVSLEIWELTLKSILLALAVATLANTKARLHAVVWMIVVSIGYHAVKGGGFVLLTGGRSHVYGADHSMISDNNALGLVLVLLLPLINYLRRTSQALVTRFGCVTLLGLTIVAVIGTYSRGALIALAAAIATYAVRSRSGIVAVMLSVLAVAALPQFLPQAWLDRMSTIQTYNDDASFSGRVVAWKMNTAIAAERPMVGGGFYAGNVDWVAKKFSGGALEAGKAAHSIYFEVLGDHGYVGLGVYILIIAGAGLNTLLALNFARGRPELAWAAELARTLQVSLAAFLVGGAALSMAYYDGALIIFALTAAVLHVVRRPAEATQAANAPRWRTAGELQPGTASAPKPGSPAVV